MAADNPREPYKKIDRNFLKEIMNEFDDFDKEKSKVTECREEVDSSKKRSELPELYQKEKNIKGGSNFSRKDLERVKNKSVVPWVIGVFLLFAVPLSFLFLKKGLICQRKSKK